MPSVSVALNKKIPNCNLLLTGEQQKTLADFRGQHLVLYFYPKASTPGCTQEGLDFNAALAKFKRAGCVVLGASRDSLKAQTSFKEKQGFKFDLVADTDETLCKLFDVIKMKTMYGKQVMGIERSTFLIDKTGVLRAEWRGVKVPEHVEAVLAAVKALGA